MAKPTNEVAENVTEPLNETSSSHTAQAQPAEPQPVQQTIVKKSGTGLSLLAILIALGLGGAGYYFGQQQVTEIQQKLTALEGGNNTGTQVAFDNSANQAQFEQLTQTLKSTQDNLAQLSQTLNEKNNEITALQAEVKRVGQLAGAQQPSEWLFSEADFLLNNALRKLVLDNDVDTAVSLLKLADETLGKVNSTQAINVRKAIDQDLKQLLALSGVDQNTVMQKLSQLANTVDELQALNVNFEENAAANEKLTDSLEDWKENAEKSAMSFLNHFIRISPKQDADKKELLAPNQDIYLRENIRLRLQLAIMAVPRQQDDLYKQSLEAVGAWVRSYFDTSADVTQTFLKSVDELAEMSIYVDTPSQLKSLTLLDQYLNRAPLAVQKVEIEADKAIESMPKAQESQAEETVKEEAVKEEAKPDSAADAPAPQTEPQQ